MGGLSSPIEDEDFIPSSFIHPEGFSPGRTNATNKRWLMLGSTDDVRCLYNQHTNWNGNGRGALEMCCCSTRRRKTRTRRRIKVKIKARVRNVMWILMFLMSSLPVFGRRRLVFLKRLAG